MNDTEVNKFLNELEIYYEAYYEDEEGFDNSDDVVAIINLSLTFYEQQRGENNEFKHTR